LRLVLIEWLDSYGCSSTWQDLSVDDPKPIECRSVGWLLHDGAEAKVVVPHVAEGPGQGCGDMTIPAAAIRRIVDLEIPNAVESSNFK
jgi:hypothetical protein